MLRNKSSGIVTDIALVGFDDRRRLIQIPLSACSLQGFQLHLLGHSYGFVSDKLLFWQHVSCNVWHLVIYPSTGVFCPRLCRDGLGPCYYPLGGWLSMYAIDCTILKMIGSR